LSFWKTDGPIIPKDNIANHIVVITMYLHVMNLEEISVCPAAEILVVHESKMRFVTHGTVNFIPVIGSQEITT
jgi:hypothetical protein